MRINADFGIKAVMHGARMPWTPSPIPGVERRMLDRIGGEVARATSIVRYAPGSHFAPHVHGGGEEFLVLEGVFQDEHGDYPTGTYVRNPPRTRHTPGSEPGCVLLVKLWQFDPDDARPVVLDTAASHWQSGAGQRDVEVMPLFAGFDENVRLERWAPQTSMRIAPDEGTELLVLSGGFEHEGEAFARHAWLRLPCGVGLQATVGGDGCTAWIKSGHLKPPVRLPLEQR